MSSSTKDQQTQKKTAGPTVAESKPQQEEIDILEDDEFEEFETEDWPEKTEEQAEDQLEWEEDWEDDEIKDDEFAKDLRAELVRHKMIDE